MTTDQPTDFYEYKATGTDRNGRRFKVTGPTAPHINAWSGNLWERVNGRSWRKVKTWSN